MRKVESKAVLISIQPQWCTALFCGDKNVEVRKTKPKLQPPFKCYVYCTKGSGKSGIAEGMVIGEFVCDRIEYMDMDSVGIGFWENDNFNYIADLGWNTWLSLGEFISYTEGKRFYGWHISKPVIYDKPKELSAFNKRCPKNHECKDCEHLDPWDYPWDRAGSICGHRVKRPPQSWCYVEEVK